MKNQPHIIFCLILLIGFLLPGWAPAQSITASFDPSEAVRMPSAAGWSDTEAFGFSYREASGNRKMDGDETHKFETSATTGNLRLKFSNISIDVGIGQSSTDVTVEQLQDLPIILDQSTGGLNVALLGNDFVSVGLGVNDYSRHEFQDTSNDNQHITESAITGSISVKTLDFLYLGGAYERVKQKSDSSVENSWNTVLLGASAIFGEAGSTRFRLEYSYANSPETISDPQGDLRESVHEETHTTAYSAELILNGLLFVARGTEDKAILHDPYIDPEGKKHDVFTITKNEAGVLWIPESGMVLGFYFANSKTSFAFEDENSEFRINLAYIFE